MMGTPGSGSIPSCTPTSPYHSNCLRRGQSTDALALSFPAQAVLYTANDGSGGKILNFVNSGTVVAQLVYDADAGTTTGSGVLVGHDGFVPWRFWSVGFGQQALNFTGCDQQRRRDLGTPELGRGGDRLQHHGGLLAGDAEDSIAELGRCLPEQRPQPYN